MTNPDLEGGLDEATDDHAGDDRDAAGRVLAEPALELGPPPSGALVMREVGGVPHFSRVPWERL